MRTKIVLMIIALCLASFSVIQAQDATPEATPEGDAVVCDSDLILNLYVAERYFGFGTVRTQMMSDGATDLVDVSTLDYGQYSPLFDSMMSMSADTTMTDEQVNTVSGMLMMDDSELMGMMETMMPEMDMSAMTMLPEPTIEGEADECTSLRTELRRFYSIVAYQGMMMDMVTGGSSSDVINFSTTLSGAAEVPGPGDEDGTGTAAVTVDMPNGQICYTLNVQNITLPAAAAHIHRGEAGVGGDVVVPFDNAPDASGTSTGCVFVEADLLNEIASNPAGFYVNVHSEDFPSGAVRGQVNGSIAAPVAEATADADATSEATEDAAAPAPTETVSLPVITTTLSGAAEIPGPGDDDGTGTATVTIDAVNNQICYALTVLNITLPASAAHIHRGEAGVSGGVVVPLDAAPDASGASSGCATVDAALIAEITANPAGFYVNVHNSDFPDGAVRGQLG